VRDIGVFIWIVLLLVGVIGSMVSSVRRQLKAAQPHPSQRPAPPQTVQKNQQEPAAWLARITEQLQAAAVPPQAPAAPRRAVGPRPAPPKPAPPPLPAHHEWPSSPSPGKRLARELFGSKNGVVRSMIAAEVLGKPKALRDE
jgi:hypothetical protein